MAIIARAIRTITDLFDPIQQGTAPASPVTGMLWLDTSLTPNQLKRWNGTAWGTVNDPAGILTRLNAAETKITDSAIVSTVRSSSEYLSDLSGKNRTWLQSTAPTGANVGDLWIDTANGNLLKRWNGSSWANVQDAAVSIAQQTADKISWIVASGTSASNMTLTSQLYSLVSQNVVINADNLTATARDTLKLEAVGAIQVGGTNLLPGTSDAYANLVHSNTNYLYPGGTYYQLADMGLKVGDTVTARAYIKTDANVPAGGYRLGVTTYNGTTSITIYYSPDLILPSSEGYSSVTFVIPANTTAVRYIFRTYGSVNIIGTEQFKRLKLEVGNKATDWSPAPADTTNAIASAVSGRTTIWYQNALPTATETGDLWYDTDANPVTIKRWSGSAWVDITTVALSQALAAANTANTAASSAQTTANSANTAASSAQTTANSKIRAWAQASAPTASATGDLWIDTDANNQMYRWSGSAWTAYKIASGYVATSKITIDSDSIDIVSGGSLTLTSPTTLSITAGSTNATAIAIKNTGTYFLSAGHLTQASAPFSVTMAGALKATSGVIGGFSIDASRHYYGDPRVGYGDSYFVDLSKWGLAVGKDMSGQNPAWTEHPVRATALEFGDYGHFMAKNGNFGIASFAPTAFAIRTWPSGKFYGTDANGTGRVTKVWIDDSGNTTIQGYLWSAGNVSALSFTDRTPAFTGKAVTALKAVKDDGMGGIDHKTLPSFARKTLVRKAEKCRNSMGEEYETEPEHIEEGRDLGAMISILTKAVQELDERLDKLEVNNGEAV